MRKHLAALEGKPAIYHCVSRVVDRRKILGFAEKEKFVRFMRQYEAFCQVRVLTYCVMGNHFHILVEVPGPPEDRGSSWSDERFLAHLSARYRGAELAALAARLRGFREQGLDKAAEEFRQKFFARMWDLSWFMRLLKQRFAQWYNYRGSPGGGKRDGYLWSDRFRSVIVEPGRAVRAVAAYIDLNPVRAGLAEDPAGYRWCGYGEAAAGGRRAREGLGLVVLGFLAGRAGAAAAEKCSKWEDAGRIYRWTMFLDGEENFRNLSKGRAGIPRAKVLRALAESGEFSGAELRFRRERMRRFGEALALGSGDFVEGIRDSLARGKDGGGGSGGGSAKRRKARSGGGGTEASAGGEDRSGGEGGWLRILRGSKTEAAVP